MLSKGKIGEMYLIGGESERNNLDVVTTIAGLLDEMAPQRAPHQRFINFVEDRPGHDHRYAINPSKIKRELGWRPQMSFEQGLRQTVRWYLDNKTWWEPIVSKTYRLERLGTAS